MATKIQCLECGEENSLDPEWGAQGDWNHSYRIDLVCPICETFLGTVPNPNHKKRDITWEEVVENLIDNFAPSKNSKITIK